MNDYKNKMIHHLPTYERKSKVFNELLNTQGIEFNILQDKLKSVERNIFIDSAIELLYIYERDLGIKSIESLNNEQRREQIASRNRAALDQTTINTIKSVAIAFSNGDVEINTTDDVGLFEIKFVGVRGIPNNIDGLKEALDIIIPAHLELTYTFTYNVWEFIKNKTWDDVMFYTWDEIRNEVF